MKKIIAAAILLAISFSGCSNPQTQIETQTPQLLPPTLESSSTPTPESPAEKRLELPTSNPQSIQKDIAAKPCSISWSNNGEYLPCPGTMDDISGGYIDRVDNPVINGAIQVSQPAILTIPAQPDSSFRGIFGKLPPYTVQAGDHFMAVLACEENHRDCDVNYSLEYYTSNNQILPVSGAEWHVAYDPGGSYVYADANLKELTGRTLQFLLVVRDNGDPVDDYALWIEPRIENQSD